jgi:general secretion pathway protein J
MKMFLKNERNGFTLLEIMVALALFALVAAAIYSSWFAVMRGSQVGLASAAKVQRSRVAMQIIEEALCSTRSFDADGTNYYFIGENGGEATLSFVSKLSPSFPRSGKFGDFDVRRVEFALEPGPDSSKQLVLRQRPILMELDKDEKLHPIVIAKDVKRFAMEFWDTRPPKNQVNNNAANTIEWLDEWDETNRLPAMVKITLQFKGDDFAQKPRENVKIVGLASQAVSVNWQRARGGQPGVPGAPGGPGSPISLPGGKP